MADPYAETLTRLARSVLESPGGLDPDLRHAAETLGRGGQGDLPPDLRLYLEKVARHAYKVTDSDFGRLVAAGYSEDAIFEATAATALGAARVRLERALAVIEEAGC